GPPDPIAIAKVRVVQERYCVAPSRYAIELRVESGRLTGLADRGGHRKRLLQGQRHAGEATGERDPPRERLRHGPDDGEVRGHARLGEPGADALVAMGAAELGARR